MSKGSRQRKASVSSTVFDNNWNAIFGKPDPRVLEDAALEDEAFKELEMKKPIDNVNSGSQDK